VGRGREGERDRDSYTFIGAFNIHADASATRGARALSFSRYATGILLSGARYAPRSA